MREKVRGEYGFSSLVKQNKKGKICASPDFFFKIFSVMKCLRSKKRKSAPLITTFGVLHSKIDTQRSHFACGVCTYARM